MRKMQGGNEMKFHKDSWINQLVMAYKKIPADRIDDANAEILDCLFSIEKIVRGEK